MSVVISDFNTFIKTRKSTQLSGKKGLARGGRTKPFFVPPVNTNPNLESLALKKISKTDLAKAIIIPPEYDLMTDPKYDGRIIIPGDRSSESTSQFMQYSCGSCWAYAVATCISDAFVVTKNLAYNPRLSWTYMMSCAPSMRSPSSDPMIQPSAQCGGGDVASAMLWAQKNGITSSNCVDYSWCVSNPSCTGTTSDADMLNSLIPSCGCYFNGSFLLYKIKNVNRICLGNCENPRQPITDDEIITFRNLIRQHIIQYGPVIGALLLLSNIVEQNPLSGIAGDFKNEMNPKGVYLECVGVGSSINTTLPAVENIADQCAVSGSPYPNSILGGHAIAVMGWGMAPVHHSLIQPSLKSSLQVDENGMIQIPYWRIRNSWGDRYADNGCYNHAMYPFNKISQIDKTVMITDPTSHTTFYVGGCVIFQPDSFDSAMFPANDGKGKASAGMVQIQEDGINTGLFPGRGSGVSSTGSSQNIVSNKIAFAPLYRNPPETPIPLHIPTSHPPSSSPPIQSTSSPIVSQQQQHFSSSDQPSFIIKIIMILVLFILCLFSILIIVYLVYCWMSETSSRSIPRQPVRAFAL